MSIAETMNKSWYLLFFLVLLSVPAVAHHIDEGASLAYELKSLSISISIAATVALILTVLHALYLERNSPKDFESQKKLIFGILIIISVGVTIILLGSTIWINSLSETSGPVHWHADFEIWKCGEKIDLKDPEGLVNRIGSPLLHEHGDLRMHVEGTPLHLYELNVRNFFRVIGGSLINSEVTVPTNEGVTALRDGDNCNGEEAELQFFLYRVTNPDPGKKSGFFYKQQKVDDFEDYILSPYANVPPGDCFIIELGPAKEKTDKICVSYRVAEENGFIKEAEDGS